MGNPSGLQCLIDHVSLLSVGQFLSSFFFFSVGLFFILVLVTHHPNH